MSFDSFWLIWPRKCAKKDARKAAKDIPDDLWPEIIAHVIDRTKNDPQWLNPLHIPYPATFLRGERWEDIYVTEKKPQAYVRDTTQPPSQEYMDRLTKGVRH